MDTKFFEIERRVIKNIIFKLSLKYSHCATVIYVYLYDKNGVSVGLPVPPEMHSQSSSFYEFILHVTNVIG